MAKGKTISLGFHFEMDDKTFKDLMENCEAFRKAMESTVKKTEGFSKSLVNITMVSQSIGNLKGALGDLSNLLNDITEESRLFNDAMRATNTMAGKDSEGFAILKDQVTELSKVVPVARDALANGLYQVISNGVPEGNWISFLEASARSSVGGMADLGQAVGVTSTLIKNYGASWEDAAAIQDKIQLTAKNGVTSFEQLAAALPRVAGNAATLGVSIDELMASFSTLTGVSGNTAEVSTQIAAIFTALVKPSSEAGKMAAAMGIQFDAAAIKAAGGFSAFLASLDGTVKSYAKTTGMLEQEIYGKLFGSAESLRALIPLQGELRDKFVSNIDSMKDSAGTMDEAFADMEKTGASASQRLINSMAWIGDAVSSFVAPVKPMLNFSIATLGAAANLGILATTMGALKRAMLGGAIGRLVTTVGLYSTAAGRATVATVGLRNAVIGARGGAQAAAIAFRGLAVSIGALAAVGAVIWGISKAIQAMNERNSEAAKTQKMLNDIKEEASRRLGEETVKINTLLEAARNEKLSLEDRQTAINKLNEIIPDYNGQLDKTTGKYIENKKALDDYLGSLMKQYEIEGAKDQLKSLAGEKAKLKISRKELETKRDAALTEAAGMKPQGTNMSFSSMYQGSVGAGNNNNKEPWKKKETEAKGYSKQLNQIDKDLAKIEDREESITGVYGLDIQKSALTQSEPTVENIPIVPEKGKKPKKSKTKQDKQPSPEKSIGWYQEQISDLDAKIKVTVDPESLAKLAIQKADLQESLDIRVRYVTDKKEIDKTMAMQTEIPEVSLEVDTSKLDTSLAEIPYKFRQSALEGNTLDKKLQNIAGAAQTASQAFSGMGQAFELPALNVMGVVAQAIASMAMGFATAMASPASTAAGVFGWIGAGLTGIATLATMISQIKNMTAFANGGIVSGPTMALVGEYAGARNNPEVIAPLNKLREMIPDGGASPVVLDHDIRIEGSTLVIALRNATQSGARTGRRSGII